MHIISNHRVMLYDRYHGSMQYPFLDGYGGARVLLYIKPIYKVIITKAETTEDGFFKVGYKVETETRHMPKLTYIQVALNKIYFSFMSNIL